MGFRILDFSEKIAIFATIDLDPLNYAKCADYAKFAAYAKYADNAKHAGYAKHADYTKYAKYAAERGQRKLLTSEPPRRRPPSCPARRSTGRARVKGCWSSTGSISSADVPKGCSTDFSEREGGHSHGGDQDRDMGHGSHGCHLLLLLASVSVKPGHGAA